jgi:hypothetical protein
MSGSSLWVDNNLTIYASDGNVTGNFDSIAISSIDITDINSSTDINITASNAVNVAGSAINLSSIGPITIVGSGVTITTASVGGGGDAADITIIGGNSATGSGGNVTLQGGQSHGSGADRAGTVFILGGESDTSSDADSGWVIIRGGQESASASGDGDPNPGDVQIYGGAVTAGSRGGGQLLLSGGVGSSLNSGGSVVIVGGSTSSAQDDGGRVRIEGGGATGGSAGTVVIQGGNGSTAGAVTITGGTGTGASSLLTPDIVIATGTSGNASRLATMTINSESDITVSATNNIILTGSVVDIAAGDLTLSGSGQILAPNGCASFPTISFASDVTTGLYRSGAGTIQLVASTQVLMAWDGPNDTVFVQGGVQMAIPDGSVDNPAIRFTTDTDTGIYSTGVGVFNIAASGLPVINASGGGVDIGSGDLTLTGSGQILTTDGSAGAPTHSFAGETDTGLYQHAAATLGFAVNGTPATRMTSAQIQAPNGASAAPGYAFASNTNTGMFNVAGGLQFSTSGSAAFFITSGSAVTARAQLRATEGLEVWSTVTTGSAGGGGASAAATHPIQLVTSVSAVGTIDASARGWTVSVSGHLIPIGVSAQDLGTNNNPLRDLYLSGSSISLDGQQVVGKSSGEVEIGGASAAGKVTVSSLNNLNLLAGSDITISATNTVILSGSVVDIATGDLTLTGSGQILPTDGSVGAPTHSFADDPSTGMYSGGDGIVRLTASGFDSIGVSNTGIRFNVRASQLLLIDDTAFQPTRPIRASAGLAASPAYSFLADAATGLFLASVGTLAFAASGIDTVHVSSGGVDIVSGDLTLSGSGQMLMANGSVAAPGLAFASNTATGLARIGGALSFVTNAISRLTLFDNNLRASGIDLTMASGQFLGTEFFDETSPAYSFNGETDTGMYRAASAEIGFSTGGSTLLRLDFGSSITFLASVVGAPADITSFFGSAAFGVIATSDIVAVIPQARGITIPTQNALTAYAITPDDDGVSFNIKHGGGGSAFSTASVIGTIGFASGATAGSVDLAASVDIALGDFIAIQASVVTASATVIGDWGFTIRARTNV